MDRINEALTYLAETGIEKGPEGDSVRQLVAAAQVEAEEIAAKIEGGPVRRATFEIEGGTIVAEIQAPPAWEGREALVLDIDDEHSLDGQEPGIYFVEERRTPPFDPTSDLAADTHADLVAQRQAEREDDETLRREEAR